MLTSQIKSGNWNQISPANLNLDLKNGRLIPIALGNQYPTPKNTKFASIKI